MKSRNSFSPLRMLMVALLAIGLAANNAAFMTFAPGIADAAIIQQSSASAATALIDSGTCDAYVTANTSSQTCTTGQAIITYLGAQDFSADNQASSGTGTFNPFVRIQGAPTEQGYNTDAKGGVEFDTKTGSWTHAIKVSDIPVVTNVPGHPGQPYWELFNDINETNGATSTPISLNKVQVYFTADPAITGYTGSGFTSAASTLVYSFDGDILLNDVNAGSGRADLRYRIPISSISGQIPANCAYGDPACSTYFVLYSEWGTTTATPPPSGTAIAGATYNSDGGFEEWKTKVYPTLQIVKNTTGGNGTFGFTVTGPSTPLSPAPSITTSGGTGHTILYIVNAGTYTITEDALPAGWTFTNATCSLNGATASAYTPGANLILGATDHLVCAFSNAAAAPSLTLTKRVVNDNGGTANAAAWTLTATGSSGGFSGTGLPATGTTASLTHSVTAGVEYTLSESAAVGYSSTGTWSCSGGGTFTSPNKITLGIGESATCTITNDDIAPKLHLRKTVVNDNGGTATAADFTLTANGTGTNDLSGTSPVDSGPTLLADTWALSETGPAGYAASAWSCVGGTQNGSNITVGIGGEATCTITNDDNAPGLHLRKVVVNDNGGTAKDTDWTLTATGPTTISGTTPVDSGAGFALGTYTLSESAGPAGYSASSWVCVGGSQSGSNITLAAGQSATCTITNDDNAPALHLRKVVVNDNGGTALDTAWTLTATGTGGSPTNLSGTTPVDSTATFKADTYTLGETGPAGYTASSWVCVGGSQSGNTIAVGLGQSATCTITNDDNAPSLTLVKIVVNDNGGTAKDTDWTLSAAGPTPISGAGGAASGAGFSAGTYALSESTGPAGYTASSWVCVGGTQNGSSITLGLAESALCTITNVQQTAHLTLAKRVTNDNGGTAVPNDFTLSAAGPTPISGAGGASSVVSPGSYTLSETGPAGYAGSAWTCVKNNEQSSSGSTISLADGESATCTITNDDVAPSLTLVKNVINDNGGTAAATAWTLTATGPTTISGAGGVASGAGFKAGTYALGESAGPVGYSATAWSCVKNGGAPVPGASITLANGDTATCTITNNDNPPQTPQLGTLVVLKYNDLNGNGARDTGEPMLGNVTFTLATNGAPPGTLVTDANGSATRTGLAAGSYTIVETIPTGWFSTDPGGTTPTKTATVNAGQTTTVMFGNKQITIPPTTVGGTIVVTKYEDANRNKQRDTNENVLAGWTFAVRDGQGALVATITTGANGTASAANLVPGTYTLTESVQSGWVSTDPGGTAPSKTVTIAAGQTVNMTFGNAKIQLPSTSTAGGTDAGTTLRIAMLGLALLLFTLQRTLTRARRGLASGGRVQGKGGMR